MIGADLEPISHVSNSHQLGLVLHEVITFTVGGRSRRRGSAARAVLARSQLIDVMAVAGRGGRSADVLARRSGGMHAEAAVQARER